MVRRRLLSTTLLTLAAASGLQAQMQGAASESCRQAIALVRRSLDASAGTLARARSLEIRERTVGYSYYEQLTFEGDGERSLAEDWTYLSFADGTYVRDNWFEAPGRFFDARTIIAGGHGWDVDFVAETFRARGATDLGSQRRALRRWPRFLLEEALQRRESLRTLGLREGGELEGVVFVDADGRQLTLLLDAKTGRLVAYQTLGIHPVEGDVVDETAFLDYRDFGGVTLPARRLRRINGNAVSEATLASARVDTAVEPEKLSPPRTFTELPAPATQPPFRLTEIAPRTYLVENVGQGGNNVLVVELARFLFVMEAPEEVPFADNTTRVIELLAARFPDKPIRYAAVSHYHIDHAGGVGRFAALGATIVVTPAAASFVRHAANPDPARWVLSPTPPPRTEPRVEVVPRGKPWRLADETNEVVLYDVGPYAHAAEELIAHLPRAGIVFEADLLIGGNEQRLPPARPSAGDLIAKIRQLDLPVRTIVGVHGKARGLDEVLESLERSKRMLERRRARGQRLPQVDEP